MGRVAAEFEAFLFFCRFWFPADNDFHCGGASTTSFSLQSRRTLIFGQHVLSQAKSWAVCRCRPCSGSQYLSASCA